MKLSVVIPTYNRPKILTLSLKSLIAQTLAPKYFEVIVVDDGSKKRAKAESLLRGVLSLSKDSSDGGTERKNTPGVAECLPAGQAGTFREWREKQTKFKLRFFKQTHKGPAAARNLGIKKAKGKIILFLGDDIIASKNLLASHLKAHQENPKDNIAILGLVWWHPKLKINPFMQWLYQSGMQADYNLKRGQKVPFKHFYTSNISLKRNFLLNNGFFDEDFVYPIFEDTELGYRLVQKGLRIIFVPEAFAYHFHQIKLKEFLKKMELRGRVGRLLYKKHPQLKDKIFPTKLPLKEILRLKLWHFLYLMWPKNKTALFTNYQRLINEALIRGYYLQTS